jgi:hypothetical protein
MTNLASNQARDVVRTYHEAFHDGDGVTVRRLLADDGQFIGPSSRFGNAHEFLDAATLFMRVTKSADLKATIMNGQHACLSYDYATIVRSVGTLPIASVFRVVAGRSRCYTRISTRIDRSCQRIRRNRSGVETGGKANRTRE